MQETYSTSPTTTWKFKVGSFGQVIPIKEQVDVINSFAWMEFRGDISLKKPMVEIGVFEEYRHATTAQEKGRDLSEMRRVWMGRKVRFPWASGGPSRGSADCFSARCRSVTRNGT